ncbi:hypothetical protein AYW79_05240 [Ferroacidibacillus organovorans]|nr:MFS transporter [Ferroacidibacillus organovorans]KYP82139.1 hypothetical protein AYJ22_00350 [Ferroacidibacillus organovorans]OAG94422.1 hypothetical protein AYW79_05240 [Ferroacidibacillus organovorans]
MKIFLWTDACFGLSIGISNTLLNLHLNALGYGATMLSLVNDVVPMVALILSVPLGHLADRYGRSKTLWLGTLLMALGAVLVPLFLTRLGILFGEVVFAVGQAMIMSTEFAVVAQYMPANDRHFSISLVYANFTLMIGIGALLGGFLPAHLPLFHTLYGSTLLLGGLIFLIAPVGRLFLTPVPSMHKQGEKPAALFERPNRQILTFSIFSFISGLAYGFVGPYLNLIIKNQFHMSVSLIGLLLALNQCALFIGSVSTSWLVERFALQRTIAFLLIIVSLSYASLGFGASFLLFIVLLLIQSMSSMAFFPLLDSTAIDVVRDALRAKMQSYRALFRGVGNVISVYTGGLCLAHHAYGLAFLLTGFIYGGMLIYYLRFIRSQIGNTSSETLGA